MTTTTKPNMKFSNQTLLLILTAVCLSIPSLSEAKGFKFYGQSSFIFGSGGNDCERSVASIEKLTASIVETYTDELKSTDGCSDCKALHRQIMTHKRLVDRLVKASKGDNKIHFQATVREVNDSVRKMLLLKNKAEVSRKVSDMILKHTPLITRITNCANTYEVAQK